MTPETIKRLAKQAGKASTMTNTLLPCPFCGHIGLDFCEGSSFRWLVASCGSCGAECGETRIQTLGGGTKEAWMQQAQQDAIEVWNTRTAPQAAQPTAPPQPVNQQLLGALKAVAMDAVSIGARENAISDKSREMVDAAITAAEKGGEA